MGPWKHLEWHGATRSSTETPKMPFIAKMTKMPLVSSKFNQRSNEVQTRTKQRFFTILHQTRVSQRFLTILTKFDSKSILGGPKNPNFDLPIRTGWNQCHCDDYQILVPMTVHRSKSELEWLRCHKNRGDAPIDAPQTSESHNLLSDSWIFKIHTFSETKKSTYFQGWPYQHIFRPFNASSPTRAIAL